MAPKINVRSEQEKDIPQVYNVIKSAFEAIEYSNHKEHFLVDALRETDALDFSLIAEINGEIVGHIAFSEVTIDGRRNSWFGLAPVSVHPEYQSRGIGSKLIIKGLERIEKSGANGCALLGDPQYYNRFGFSKSDQLTLEGVSPEYFLIHSFTDEIPSGMVEYHPLFKEYG